MKISISDNIIKHYLKNVYFINGHSYSGKSTMVNKRTDYENDTREEVMSLLAEHFGLK